MRIRGLAALVGACALMGCQTDGGGAAPVARTPAAWSVPGGASLPFRCPASGTAIEFTNGALTYSGADPTDPVVCLATNAAGQEQRRLYDVWILPIEDEASLRGGFAALWPLTPGGGASYSFIGRTQRHTSSRYLESWRVLRTETLEIGGSPRNAVVLQRRQEGTLGNNFLGTDTFWFDIEIGAFLKRDVGVTRDRSGGRPFEALAITTPAGR
jgi:hypothetical protein